MRLQTRMDMDPSSGSDTAPASMMGPFTTQVGTSILWFPNWTPSTGPATFGACIGLFFLAGCSRFLEALRTGCEPTSFSQSRRNWRSECVCAGLFALISGINLFLMLAVMQYSAWFFIAIVLGYGAGELGFGDFRRRRAFMICPSTSPPDLDAK